MSERGFYRIDESGKLQHAPNAVHAPTYTLRIDGKLRDPLPDGWQIHPDEATAREALACPLTLAEECAREGITDVEAVERIITRRTAISSDTESSDTEVTR